MSSNNVDNRIVNLEFNNAQFEAGVKQTLGSLEELKKSLQFNNAMTGITTLSSAFNSFSLSNIAEQVESLSSRFSTLGIVGMTAIENITNKFMNLATGKISGIIGQIQSGGWARASSIAQSRFTLQGLLKDTNLVEQAFNSASDAVDGTAYSLNSAVSVASQLAASGVDVGDDMKNTLLAIGGTAAMTGAQFEEIGSIFTTVAGQGKLMTMQLRQMESRGLNAASEIAKYLNTTEASVREMVTKGQISFETFSAAMQNAFGEHAKEANKTFSGSMDNIRSALSRIGAIFSSGIIENDTLIETLNDVRKTINKIKEAMLPLEPKFKNLVSAVSKMVSYLIKDLKFDSLNSFVDVIGRGMDTISGLINKWVKLNDKIKESVFGKVAEDAEKANEAVHATTEQIEKAREVWYQGLHGVGEARKKEFGEEYDEIQYLINQLAAGNSDLENVDISGIKKAEEAVDDTTQSINEMTDAAQKTNEEGFVPIGKVILAFKSYLSGIKTIINNIRTTVSKAVSTFKKVFSWKKLISDITDYGNAFSDFVGYFELGEERAEKLENTFSGLWSAVDLLRKGIKLLITGGLKVLGPVLSVVLDIILSITSVIGSAITKFNEWTDKHTDLVNVISWFGETLAKTIETVKTFFEKLWNLPAVNQIKDSLSDLCSLIFEKLQPYFEKAGDAIAGFFDTINNSEDSGAMQKILDGINSALENIIAFSGDATGAISDFVSWIANNVTSLIGFKDETKGVSKSISGIQKTGEKIAKSNSFGELINNLSEMVSKLGGNVSDTIDWIINKFNSLDSSKVAMVGAGAGLTAIGLGVSYLSYNLGNMVKQFTAFPTEVVNTVKSIRGVFDSVSTYLENESQADILRAWALAIATLAAALFVLSNYVDPKKLWDVTTSLALLIGLVAATVLGMSLLAGRFASAEYFKSLGSLALAFVAMAASVLILVYALEELTKLTYTKDALLGPVIALVSAIVLLVGVGILMSRFSGAFSTGSIAVVILAASLFIVVKALQGLNTLNIDGLMDRIIALQAVLITLGIVAGIMGAFHTTFGGSLAIITLIASIYLIEITLKYIIVAGVSMDQIYDNLGKFIPVLIALGVITAFMVAVGLACRNATHMVGIILSTAISIFIIVQALKSVAQLSSWEIIKGIGAVGFIFLALIEVLRVINAGGAIVAHTGGTLLALAISIGILAIVVAAMGHLSLKEIGKGVLCVALLAVLMAGLLFVSQFAKAIDYRAIYAIVVAIGVMALVVGIISTIDDLESVYAAAGIMSLMLISFGMSLLLAGKYAKRLSIGPLILMVTALVIIAGALISLSLVGDMGKMLVTMFAMSAILLALASSLAIIKKGMGSTNWLTGGKLLTIVAMIAMLEVIAASLYYLSEQDTQGLAIGAAALIVTFYAITRSLSTFIVALKGMKITSGVLGLMGLMIGIFVSLGIAISAIMVATSTTTISKAIIGVASMILLLMVMLEVMTYINTTFQVFNPAAIGAVILGIILLSSVTSALNSVLTGNDANWQQMAAGALGMVAVLIAVAAVMSVMTGISAGTGMLPMIVAMGSLSVVLLALSVAFRGFGAVALAVAKAIKMLSEIKYENIDISVLVQLVGVVSLAMLVGYASAPAFILLSVGVLALSVALTTLGVALLVIAVPFTVITIAIASLTKSFSELIKIFNTSKGSIASGITEIGLGLANAITSFVTTLAIKAPIIKASLLVIMATAVSLVTQGVNSIITIILDGIVTFLSKVDEKLPEITERINSIITTILQSLAANASTFGYYGIYIIGNFIYGLAEGFEEVAPLLGTALGDIIRGLGEVIDSALDEILPGLGDKLYDFYLEQAEVLYGLLAEWSSGVGALTGGLAGTNFIWEEGYNAIVEERAARAEEKSKDVGKAIDEGTAEGIEEDSKKVDEAAEKSVSNATDQSDAAEEGGEKTGSSYGSGFLSKITDGEYSGKIKDTVQNFTGIDLSGQGSLTGSTWATGLNTELKTETMDVSHLPTQVVKDLEDNGWKLDEAGQTMSRQVQTGFNSEDFNTDTFDNAMLESAGGDLNDYEDKGSEARENFVTGLTATTREETSRIYHTGVQYGKQLYEGATSKDGTDSNSPSKKGMLVSKYFVAGIVVMADQLSKKVTEAYAALAGNAVSQAVGMMQTISTIVQDDSADWTPTITPVFDGTQLQNGSNMLNNTFGTSALNMAANTSLAISNTSENSLAAQVQNLSDQVNKLANTDYSKMLEGVKVNVNAETNVDGTPLKKMASKYTVDQINDQIGSYNMALGGRA